MPPGGIDEWLELEPKPKPRWVRVMLMIFGVGAFIAIIWGAMALTGVD